MNRIQRFAAAAAVSTAVLTPAIAAVAFAEPRPWHNPNGETSESGGLTKTKAQIEYEERIGMQERCAGFVKAADPDATDLPWDTAGVSALGAGVLATGGAIVARRRYRASRHA